MAVLLMIILWISVAQSLSPCEYNSLWATWKLHILTFSSQGESGIGVWKSSTRGFINDNNVKIDIIGSGVNWNVDKLYNKPKYFLKYIQNIMAIDSAAANDSYAILVDSDTFFVTSSLCEIWSRFDFVRKGKEVVVSTEFNCWMGNFCNSTQIERFYNTTEYGRSVFINSGAIMGNIFELERMLINITKAKSLYEVVTFQNTVEYRDQNAVTIFLQEHSHIVALDTSQYLFANFPIMIAPTNIGRSRKFGVCKESDNSNSAVSHKCIYAEWQLHQNKGYIFDEGTCTLSRNFEVLRKIPILFNAVKDLSPTTLLWHGNGDGKDRFSYFSRKMNACLNRKKGEGWEE